MSFRTHLEQVLNQVEGSVACSVMGFDGMAIDTQQAKELEGLDLSAMLIEYGSILSKLKDAASSLQAGDISEISINTERLITIARMLTPEYYLVLAITPDGNYGKGRYALRIAAPKVKAELE
ncbi:MAG: roadblock/LC7 domain-containing protein [Myxococcales bacterium]|jgi:predicted regulator of Ras-like GTPase activity (Roadblock/LC7/MglB family)